MLIHTPRPLCEGYARVLERIGFVSQTTDLRRAMQFLSWYSLCEGVWEVAQPAKLCILDLKKAFLENPVGVLWECRVSGQLLWVIRFMYSLSESLVRIAGSIRMSTQWYTCWSVSFCQPQGPWYSFCAVISLIAGFQKCWF